MIGQHININDMLASLNMVSDGIAIAINNIVIPKVQWDEHFLNEGDKLTVIKATQGG